jgi:hypothetical protein
MRCELNTAEAQHSAGWQKGSFPNRRIITYPAHKIHGKPGQTGKFNLLHSTGGQMTTNRKHIRVTIPAHTHAEQLAKQLAALGYGGASITSIASTLLLTAYICLQCGGLYAGDCQHKCGDKK